MQTSRRISKVIRLKIMHGLVCNAASQVLFKDLNFVELSKLHFRRELKVCLYALAECCLHNYLAKIIKCIERLIFSIVEVLFFFQKRKRPEINIFVICLGMINSKNSQCNRFVTLIS